MLDFIFLVLLNIAGEIQPSNKQLWMNDVTRRIDSLITAEAKTPHPFNGVILVKYANKKVYSKATGYADRERKVRLHKDSQFYIGSISKQITAVLALQQLSTGGLVLDSPIHRYLPQLTAPWADSVTIYHLLSHTSGIKSPDQPLAFTPGSKFAYSNLGYELLAQCIEKSAGLSFEQLSNGLFRECKMAHSAFPDTYQGPGLVTGYALNGDTLQRLEGDLSGHAASGTFISTVDDLARWNECLHGKRHNGMLLDQRSYTAMTTPIDISLREHPAFGKMYYGYGITWVEQDDHEYTGQTGLIPGFVCMDFFDPTRHLSVVVLENTAWYPDDVKRLFHVHKEILKITADLP
ncbi:beta-lactamase family protein [Chitinophaga agrisoli]|uniref:Beta-lactamase family protein n=1 Tax=Chitinophaga agrisoli TaxID=2607653 RepID=A0A5B2VNH7_9BACT|nr:serine hydrolase domain-containing protein [Chitinophaga agrisoli]KAA2239767.1 beta-lactamase family protein [Chitinophaga agrisoli]